MKTSIIQSLIDRNAKEIRFFEDAIVQNSVGLKRSYNFGDEDLVAIHKTSLSKHRQTLKKLVAIQKELKKELADNIRNENCEAIYFDIYEGVN